MAKVYIMRGLPGSGKSTWVADRVCNSNSHAPKVIISADIHHLVTEDGKSVYRYKPENAKAAHDACLREFFEYASSPLTSVEVFVDNTNLSEWEVAPYYRVAEAFGCDVEIIHCRCSPSTSIARNRHAVPTETILKMFARTDELPLWWKQTVIDTDSK